MKTNLEKAAALLEALKIIEAWEFDFRGDCVADARRVARAAIALAEAPDMDEKGWPYNRD